MGDVLLPSLHSKTSSNQLPKLKKRQNKKQAVQVIQQNAGRVASGIGHTQSKKSNIPIPDLSHIGIRTAFSKDAEDAIVYPDGYLSKSFKLSIHREYNSLPHLPNVDKNDVKYLDFERTCRKYQSNDDNTRRIRSDSLEVETDATVCSIEETEGPRSLSDSVVDICKVSWKRCSADSISSQTSVSSYASGRPHEPFSTKSLLECILDTQYYSAENAPQKRWNTQVLPQLSERDNSICSDASLSLGTLNSSISVACGKKVFQIK